MFRRIRFAPLLRRYSDTKSILNAERFADQVDVCIVGGGPAGLSAAIRIRQKAIAEGKEIRVLLVEKGAEVGSHILSGAVLEPRALNELIPGIKSRNLRYLLLF